EGLCSAHGRAETPPRAPPGPGRPAGARDPARAALPRRPPPVPRRPDRRRSLLRPERLPDHRPAPAGTARHRLHPPPRLLPAPGPAPVAGAGRDGRGVLPVRAGARGPGPVGRHPLGRAERAGVLRELADPEPWRAQPDAPAHLVARAGGAVLSRLALAA